jgi:hypothetical protein
MLLLNPRKSRRNADSFEVAKVTLDGFSADHGYGKFDLLKMTFRKMNSKC